MNVEDQTPNRTGKTSFAANMALYTLARFGLIAVVAAILALVGVPLVVALAVAIIVGFPLSMVLFRPLQRKVAIGLAERTEARNAEREKLRAQLRGEDK